MTLLDDKDKVAISEILSKGMSGDVNLLFFFDTSKDRCQLCSMASELLSELSSIDARIRLTAYDINRDKKEAKFLGIDKVPAIIVGGKKIYNSIYFGMPSGYELSSLLGDIIDASRGMTSLSKTTKEKLSTINRPIDIKVFVTPTCPYCPRAVRTAHQFAMENRNIRGSMIEAQEFAELSSRYGVMGVPKIIINDSIELEGAQPEEVFLEYVLKAAASK
jgi:glutaredoxin-like protein